MMNSPSVFIFCGEQSADIHGSLLAEGLKTIHPDIRICGIGGDRLKNAGVEIIRDNSDLAVVGFWEAVRQYGKFHALLKQVLDLIRREQIEVVVLIDFPGFNLRLAQALGKRDVKVIYYISPQLWAWGIHRLQIVRRCIDHMIVIFDFEKEFYEKEGIPATFVGHPLLDSLDTGLATEEFDRFLPPETYSTLIALLPGSRPSEIKRLLPIFLESIREIRERIPGAAFVVSSASEERFREIREINLDFSARHGTPPVPVFKGDMNQLIKKSDLVLVASGTATLQTALFGKPMVVAYRVNPITYWIIRSLIRTSFISLVNIIAKRQVVPELIQSQCSSKELARAVIRFHEDPEYRKATVSGLREIQNHVGTPGASFRAAEIIAKCIDEPNS